MSSKVVCAGNGKASMEARDHHKNGVSPKNQRIRKFLNYLTVASILALTVFTGCKKGKDKDLPTGEPTQRYETVPYVKNKSSIKSSDELYNLVHTDYDDEYNYYFFVLGHINSVPLAHETAVYYNGTSDFTMTYSMSNVTEESISNSVTEASEHSVTKSHSTNYSNEIGFEKDIKLPIIGKFEASYKHSWGGSESTDVTNSRSFSNTYTTSKSKANETKNELSENLRNSGRPAGSYRWALFTITDVYYVVVTDRAKTEIIEANVTFCARTKNLSWELDYDPERLGSFGKTASGELLQVPDINVSQLPDIEDVPALEYPDPFKDEMVFVDGGTFKMAENILKQTRNVTLISYNIGKYEVTQAQWKAVMDGNNPSNFKNDLKPDEYDNHPVEKVSWNDIVGTSAGTKSIWLKGITYYDNGFIYKLNELTGKKYRLPTEAEWQYAASGGSKSEKEYIYSGSNILDDVAWHKGNSKNSTHPVGEKKPNELGIYDMTGNVWEWCSDRYAAYTWGSFNDPIGSTSTSDINRVMRGGHWGNDKDWISITTRDSRPPDTKSNIGFRVVIDID